MAAQPPAGQREENGCCGPLGGGDGGSPVDSDGDVPDSPCARARHKLRTLLNKNMRIRMTDGRTLVGCFLCTDRDCNVILGSAQEYLKASDSFAASEPRVLGLAMVPGHHIVSIEVELESLSRPQYL
ncbi:N-alpha-acetyltransferase 38, NatC auxiliary subunit isoform X1 [Emydura macquarii macquarii]|uniref:N-alpha-acetyltransferase 38, NatC auxiliary subunit isoform X1 n=1 Tax=Emydura macquarii macquarii TaxID=1129001 RepID=UPI00352A9EB1